MQPGRQNMVGLTLNVTWCWTRFALGGVRLLWRQSGCGSATKERKNNRGNRGEMQLAASAARFETCNFCCFFSPPLKNGRGRGSFSVRVITPRLCCVSRWALIAWWILHPPSGCRVQPIWPTAWFDITLSNWPPSPVMLLMAEVYNA